MYRCSRCMGWGTLTAFMRGQCRAMSLRRPCQPLYVHRHLFVSFQCFHQQPCWAHQGTYFRCPTFVLSSCNSCNLATTVVLGVTRPNAGHSYDH
ncbi:hypothetical protein BDN72DRAFT_502797 [Pluteus cervinus]|uniref:Uncharacterized protein n=1 Tax=Pluteus cervinus TaxID=181527 RepID=A0ACD3AXT5_9AGAR|nr:hypothetical protein BDN72DRAFT_502797 [Pluteus cervinus]